MASINQKTSNVYTGFNEIKTKRVKQWIENKSKDYKEYRRKWEEYPKKLKIPNFPIHIDIEATNICNLKCPMCARTLRVEKNIWRRNKNIDFEVFKKIIDEGVKNGLCAVNLNNFGEPLINPDLPRMVKYAKFKGILDVFFHTNAVLLTKDLSKRLIGAGLDRIIISFDSPYKEKYEKIRIGAKYEQVLQNIKDLFNLRKENKFFNPLIRINMIKFPDLTDKEIDDAKELFLKIADSIGFLELEEIIPAKKEKIEFNSDYKSKFICPQPFSRLTILEDGTILPCCVDLDANMKLGNIKGQTIKEIWEGEKLKEIRKLHLKGKFYQIPTCRNCDWAIKEEKRLRNQEKIEKH